MSLSMILFTDYMKIIDTTTYFEGKDDDGIKV
jgi:hypothetical protein